MSEERKLATVRTIAALDPIPDADAIELATIDGWQVVVRKNEFIVGQNVVYFEIDSWIPKAIAPFLCSEGKSRVYNGIEGERLRTKKMRGQISQGLAMPTSILMDGYFTLQVGDDLTERLGIQKYEKPIPGEKNGFLGSARGNFPSFIPKTDEERVQNLTREVRHWCEFYTSWEVTEKLDGSSMTIYLGGDNEMHVCSRNYDIKPDSGGAFWQCVLENDLEAKLRELTHGNKIEAAVQGELVGPGVQGNKYGLDKLHFFVYKIFDHGQRKYYNPVHTQNACRAYGFDHVPLIEHDFYLKPGMTLAGILEMANGMSVINPKVMREGLVFKSLTRNGSSFKAISNEWLLHYKE